MTGRIGLMNGLIDTDPIRLNPRHIDHPRAGNSPSPLTTSGGNRIPGFIGRMPSGAANCRMIDQNGDPIDFIYDRRAGDCEH